MKSMKFKIIIIPIMIVFFSACHDQVLNKQPKTTLNPEVFWKSEKDVLSGVNRLYLGLKGMRRKTGFTDFVIGRAFQNLKIKGNVNPDISAGSGLDLPDIWGDYYESVAACNYFLDNVDKADISETLATRVKGEARFIRAFIYMELVMEFGNIPLTTKVLSREEGSNIKQSGSEEIWDFIEAELTDIYLDLPIEYEDSNIGRITRGAALALKAKTMLYAKRYDRAYKAAKDVIDLNRYSLYPYFEDLFGYEAQNSSEVIISRQYAENKVSHSAFSWYAPLSMSLSHEMEYRITRSLVDKFQMQTTGLDINASNSGYDPYNPYKNRDPRLEATIFIPAFSDTTKAFSLWRSNEKLDPRPGSGTSDEILINKSRSSTGFYSRKYVRERDINEPENSGVNYIILRYADVLLTASEALIEQDEGLAEAKKYINKVRSRAGMPELGVEIDTQSELRDAVRRERAIELALEGWRLYDIKRWEIAEDVCNGRVYGMSYLNKNGKIDTAKTSVIMDWQSKDYLLPIPTRELDLNSNLDQNPGY